MPDMVARTNPLSGFIVTFTRNDRKVEHRVARDGERALNMAMLILASLDEPHDRDVLRCTEENVGDQ
jgi:hypothetical protein